MTINSLVFDESRQLDAAVGESAWLLPSNSSSTSVSTSGKVERP